MAFSDESSKGFVGRFFTKEEFRSWLLAQRKPSWAKYMCTHHTWSPTLEQWKGESTLRGIFNYYHNTKGWTLGKGPHFWIAPKVQGGPLGIWVATHPYWQGIGAIGWNNDTLHVEYAWNGDKAPFTADQLKVGAVLAQAVRDWVGIPIQDVSYGGDGFAVKGKSGHLFHRDTRKANKTCPGTKNDHKTVFDAYAKQVTPVPNPDPSPPQPKPTESDWTPEALYMKQLGVVTGYPDGSFRPNEQLTRGQAATLAKRLYSRLMSDISKAIKASK